MPWYAGSSSISYNFYSFAAPEIALIYWGWLIRLYPPKPIGDVDPIPVLKFEGNLGIVWSPTLYLGF